MEFADPNLNLFPFHYISNCYLQLKCGKRKLYMEECSTKNHLKNGATDSKFSIWHLGHTAHLLVCMKLAERAFEKFATGPPISSLGICLG